MWSSSALILSLCFLSEAASRVTSSVKPLKINLSERVPHMLDLVHRTHLPPAELSAAKSSYNTTLSSGLPLSTLKSLRKEWITSFKWELEQESINQYHHFTTKVEGQDIHFIQEPSQDPNAVPIILLHGWPGSFLEMLPLIDLLTLKEPAVKESHPTSFNVVLPSLPGFGLSTPAPDGWTTSDTARILNTLMTKVLGYQTYAVHGTDWGCAVAYELYGQFNTTVRAAHLNFLPFVPPNLEQLAALNITLSGAEVDEEKRSLDWQGAGSGYFAEQTTKPNTIGLALYDNPIGQLTWIAEKFILWSDPRRGSGPSVLTDNEILRVVSLYYLTHSFVSSVYIYAQNPGGFATKYTKAKTDAPLLYTSFNYNVGFWPKALVEEVGNLVYYKFQEFGGHFPALDNPPALAADISMIGKYWHH
ncbi:Alpha/Beta hydrolase protein [Lipomyces orientalis]|uniref:Alpha/Beta hydrolase protein n=1 Tax=Lipomyces orientalis TaxID=1233043 RepID=A0ACC3TCI6_9ASCO